MKSTEDEGYIIEGRSAAMVVELSSEGRRSQGTQSALKGKKMLPMPNNSPPCGHGFELGREKPLWSHGRKRHMATAAGSVGRSGRIRSWPQMDGHQDLVKSHTDTEHQ